MRTYKFEARHGHAAGNWGKFAVLIPDDEWLWRSGVDPWPGPLLRRLGWGPEHIWVMDLQTGEGFIIRPGGLARADIAKHAVWVCPMFDPWLTWLYGQLRGHEDISARLKELPPVVDLPDAPFAFRGYRRQVKCGSGWPA